MTDQERRREKPAPDDGAPKCPYCHDAWDNHTAEHLACCEADMAREDDRRERMKWAARERLACTDPALIAVLVDLGDRFGPTGVKGAAADLVLGWEPGAEAAFYSEDNYG